MSIPTGNLFSDAVPPDAGERFETLLRRRNLVVERIVSSAATTREEYVQVQDEWVVLLRGQATLQVAGETVVLGVGDHVFLPAGLPHAVDRISDGALWLTVHLYPKSTPRNGG